MKFKLDFNLDRNPTLAQIKSLPPTGRYVVIALALLAAYFAVDSWSWSWARQWNADADRIEKILNDSAEIAANSESAPSTGPETFGPVFPIGPVFPVAPVFTANPSGPVGPVEPVGPVVPVEPVGAMVPVEPVGPVGPLGRGIYLFENIAFNDKSFFT